MEGISPIPLSDTHGHIDGIPCAHTLSPLIQKKQMPLSLLHRHTEHTILITIDITQSRSRRCNHPTDAHVDIEIIPPPT